MTAVQARYGERMSKLPDGIVERLDIKVDGDGTVWLIFKPEMTMISVNALAARIPDGIIGHQLRRWIDAALAKEKESP